MMDNPTLNELAQKADALISNRNQYSMDSAISSHLQQNKTATKHNIHSQQQNSTKSQLQIRLCC